MSTARTGTPPVSLESVYLDYHATAPMRPEVAAVVMDHLTAPANPSSGHAFGRAARAVLGQARRTIAEAVGAFPGEMTFTSGGTEANAMALAGFPGRAVAVSAVEHPSVLAAHPNAARLPVDSSGVLELAALDGWLRAHPGALVSVQLANNETGVLQPIADIARAVHAHSGLLHVDAVQAFGKVPVDVGVLGADMLSIAAHKMGGPKGAGALYLSQRVQDFQPLLRGGAQESRRRAGTENVPALAGFAEAVRRVDYAHLHTVRRWLDALEAAMLQADPATEIPGHGTPRLPTVTCATMPGVRSETQLMHYDLAGIAVSAGSACSSGRVEPSHVLLAMGIPPASAQCALRISGGWATTEADLHRLWHARQTLLRRTSQATGNEATGKERPHPNPPPYKGRKVSDSAASMPIATITIAPQRPPLPSGERAKALVPERVGPLSDQTLGSGHRPNLTELARHLRHKATDAERKLWGLVRSERLGVKFRRQQQIGRYVCDFVCPTHKLVLEADGSQHAGSQHDATRDAFLTKEGYRVLRFWNNDILTNPTGVVEAILHAIDAAASMHIATTTIAPQRPPLPSGERAGERVGPISSQAMSSEAMDRGHPHPNPPPYRGREASGTSSSALISGASIAPQRPSHSGQAMNSGHTQPLNSYLPTGAAA